MGLHHLSFCGPRGEAGNGGGSEILPVVGFEDEDETLLLPIALSSLIISLMSHLNEFMTINT